MKPEIAVTICQAPSGQLCRGTEAIGSSPYNVQLRIGCPPGTVVKALHHSHPGGLAKPSPADILEAKRLGLNHLCIENDFELRCYKV